MPTSGGDTQYVNMHDAYDDLPEATKRKIDGLKAVHVYQSKYSPRSLGTINEESRRNLPPPGIHPLVRTHPENGRKALFLNPVRMESIIGMEDKEALALIDELMRHATQRKYEYRHKWRHGDWVMWDNRSVIHWHKAADRCGANVWTLFEVKCSREDDYEPCISSDNDGRGCRQRAVGDSG